MTTGSQEQPRGFDYYIDLETRYGARNYAPLDVVLERAEVDWALERIEPVLRGLPS